MKKEFIIKFKVEDTPLIGGDFQKFTEWLVFCPKEVEREMFEDKKKKED